MRPTVEWAIRRAPEGRRSSLSANGEAFLAAAYGRGSWECARILSSISSSVYTAGTLRAGGRMRDS
jgi:hypothetical protein